MSFTSCKIESGCSASPASSALRIAERGFAAREELLALEVKLRVEPVVFAVMLELRERGEGARRVREHDRACGPAAR